MNILLCILKLPIGIVNFVVAVTLVAASLSLIATPAVYVVLERTFGLDMFASASRLAGIFPELTSLQLPIACTAVGIVLSIVPVAAIRNMAPWTARFTLSVAKAPGR